MEQNIEVEVTTTDDGRWDDDVWVNQQAELSAAQDMIERGLEVA